MVDKRNFDTMWDDFHAVARYFRKHFKEIILLAIYDWEKAYRQARTKEEEWRYLAIKDFRNRIWMDIAVPFGGVAGCGTFGKVADAWRLIIMKVLGIDRIFRWVDDNMIVKLERDNLQIKDVVEISAKMGVKTNHEKLREFAEEQKYLGFIFNGVDKTVRLPDEKLTERLESIEKMLSGERPWSLKEADSLIGKLAHLVYIVPHMKAYMRGLYAWLNPWEKSNATRHLSRAAKRDLESWKEALTNFEPRRIIPEVDPEMIGWVGDASGVGIGVICKYGWVRFKLKEGWRTTGLTEDETCRDIAWAETAAIRLGLLMLEISTDVRGRNFWVKTDNTTTESTIHKRRSKSEQVNEEWKKIQNLLLRLQCDITEERVESGDNDADGLSRGFDEENQTGQRLIIQLPYDLELLLEEL
jgi:hypothetical protein